MSRRELRVDVALAVLVPMVAEIKSSKSDKVRAAFEYADLFLEEMDRFDRKHEGLRSNGYESPNRAGLFRPEF